MPTYPTDAERADAKLDLTELAALADPQGAEALAAFPGSPTFASQAPLPDLGSALHQASSFTDSSAAAPLATEAQIQAIDAIAAMDPYDAAELAEAAESDFGPLQMFDSNSSQIPLSSFDDATRPRDEGKKSKHKKKKSKKERRSQVEVDPVPEEEEVQASIANEYDVPDDDEAIADQLGVATSKRKHRASDSGDGKRSKKRRTSNLSEQAIAEEVAPENGDFETAPLATQPEPVQLNNALDAMDTDGLPQPHAEDMGMDVQKLAEDAFNNRNGSANQDEHQEEQQPAYEAPTAVMEEPAPSAPAPDAVADTSLTSPKRSRTKSRKAKPTLFEVSTTDEALAQDANDDSNNPMWELPSPTAASPKPRRAKAPSKRSRDRKKTTRDDDVYGGDGDEENETGAKRKNKAAGYIQGRFSNEELAAMDRAVERFRQNSGKTQYEVNAMIQAAGGTTAGEEHAQMWNSIFAEVPDRYRQKVINTCRKRFHNFVARAKWTPEQDQELRDLIEKHSRPNQMNWSVIAGLINRHPEDVRDRYRNYLVCGEAQRKDAWTEEEEQRLTQFIIEAMTQIDEMRRLQPSRELLKKTDEELIDWQYISECMGRTRSRLQCITKWRSMNLRTHPKDKLASKDPNNNISFRLEKARRQLQDMPDEERYRLVIAIQATAVSTDAKIPWQKLIDKQFRNRYARATQALLWYRLKQTVPDHGNKTVRDIAQELVQHYNMHGSLPAVDDDNQYDVQNESEVLSALSSTGGSARGPRKSTEGPISEEQILNSDVEDQSEMQVGEPPAAHEMIDPALIAVAAEGAQEAALAAALDVPLPETPMPKPAKKTYTRRKNAKKAVEPSQDPIEDDSQELPTLPTEPTGDDDNIEEATGRSTKKTPGKFKPSKAGKESTKKEKTSSASAVADGSDSVMDDMEDLPARVAT